MKKLKQTRLDFIIIIISVLSVLLVSACHRGSRASQLHDGRDTVYTIKYIQNIAIERPMEALAILDTAEEKRLLSPFDINDLRSLVYHNGLSRYKTALFYSRKAYNDPEAQKHPKRRLSLLSTMADDSHTNGDYAGSVKYCADGLKLAKELGNKTYEADLHVTWGMNLMETDQEDEALRHFDLGIGILSEEVRRKPGYHTWDELFYALGMKLAMLYERGRNEKAYAMRPLIEKALNGLEESKDAPEGLSDMRRAEMDAMFCPIAYATGHKAEGERLYKRLDTNPYTATPDGEYVRIPSLVAAGRYDEALSYIYKEKKLLQETTDTMNRDYVEQHLQFELEALQGKGHWREASRVQSEMLAIEDTLRKRKLDEDALELSEIYKSEEKDTLIKEQQLEANVWRIVSGAAIVLLSVTGVFTVAIVRKNKGISRRNLALAAQVKWHLAERKALDRKIEEHIAMHDQLEEAKKELKEVKAQSAPPETFANETIATEYNDTQTAETDRILFERIICEIKNCRLFCSPSFSRTELLKIVPVPQNKFAKLFKQFAGMTFTAYVRNLRLEYANELFIEHPDWTTNAIINECGMQKSSFYAAFIQKFGVNPDELRKSLQKQQRNDAFISI